MLYSNHLTPFFYPFVSFSNKKSLLEGRGNNWSKSYDFVAKNYFFYKGNVNECSWSTL